MKNSLALLVCLIFGALCAIAIFIVGNLGDRSNLNETFRMSYKAPFPVVSFDPAQISFDHEYMLLDNLVRPLVDVDNTGDLVGDLAARFEWVGDELHFTMRRWDGGKGPEIISAKDAALSLKRLMIIGSNSHGNIADLLCRGKSLQTLNDDCEGIEVRAGKLILKPGKRSPFLLSMLVSIDFGMLSKENYDAVTLKITSYANTTGPYGVKSDDGNGNIVLRANPRHHLWSKRMPQEVVLIPPPSNKLSPLESIENFERNRVDFLTTTDAAKGNDLFKKYGAGTETADMFYTDGIRDLFLLFSQNGLKKLSKVERFAIGNKVRTEYLSSSEPKGFFKPAFTFFPTFGELTRDTVQVDELKSIDTSSVNLPINRQIKFHTGRSEEHQNFWTKMGPLISTDPNAILKSSHALVTIGNDEDTPDFSFASADSGAFEDINLVSYTVTSGTFGQTPDEARVWLALYQNEMNKDLRLIMLNDLHFKALEEGVLIPIATSSYGAAVRKPWKMNFSKLSSTSPLWRITRD